MCYELTPDILLHTPLQAAGKSTRCYGNSEEGAGGDPEAVRGRNGGAGAGEEGGAGQTEAATRPGRTFGDRGTYQQAV